jgi:hypothetical protein
VANAATFARCLADGVICVDVDVLDGAGEAESEGSEALNEVRAKEHDGVASRTAPSAMIFIDLFMRTIIHLIFTRSAITISR